MALTWTMTLKDAMSGAANRASRAVDKVTASLHKADKASAKPLASKQFDGMANSAQRAGRAVDQLQGKMGKLGGGAKGGGGGGGGGGALGMIGMAGPIGAAAAIVAALAAASGTVAYGFGKLALDSKGFKTNTLFALEAITHTKEGAQAAYDIASKTADRVGGDFRTSMSAMNALMATGFDTNFSDQLIRAMADLKTLNPAANMDGIVTAMRQIKTTGKLQGDELMQLAEAGLNVSAVYDEIAKSMGLVEKKGKGGTVREQIEKLQGDGKIGSDTAIAAIMSSIKKQTGRADFGDLAAEKAGGIGGAFMRLNNAKERFMSNIDIDWSPLQRTVERITAVMDSPAGARFSQKISEGFGRLLGFLDSITEKDMAGYLSAAGDAIEGITKTMVGAAKAGKFLLDVVTGISNWGEKTLDLNLFDLGIVPLYEKLASLNIGSRISTMFSEATAAIYEGAASVGSAITGFFGTIAEVLGAGAGGAYEAGFGVGKSIGDGMAAGISGAIGAVGGAASSLAGAAYSAAKSYLQTGSPSRLFDNEVGYQIPAGAKRGIERGTPEVEDASSRMGEAAFRGGQRLGANVSSASYSANMGGVTFNGSGGEDDEAMQARTMRHLADSLRGMNQSGA